MHVCINISQIIASQTIFIAACLANTVPSTVAFAYVNGIGYDLVTPRPCVLASDVGLFDAMQTCVLNHSHWPTNPGICLV
jgi:hypothetical protein